jgi:hypothetical protein
VGDGVTLRFVATVTNVKESVEMLGKNLMPQKLIYQKMIIPVEFSTPVTPLTSVHSASVRRVGVA